MPLKPPASAQDHLLGNSHAKLELVEYGDYQCPHCGHAHPIIKQVLKVMGNDLKFVFRNFPLTEIHPQAQLAAVATEAANRQGKYWEMHDLVFENQQKLRLPDLLGYARQLGLDMEKFETDMGDNDLVEIVEEDFESGIRSGVNGTPTFFINGQKYGGSWEAEELIDFLKKKLEE